MDDNVIDLKRGMLHTTATNLAAIELIMLKFSDIRAQLTKIDDELTRQRHLLEQIKACVEKFR